MNRSNIEWTQFTSNPIRGKCLHLCPYCYAERIRLRFKQSEDLSWHPDELTQIKKRKTPSVIFMGSMYDILGEWVHENYIHWILDTAENCPQHTFLFLTKNPARYRKFDFPDNCWEGVTVTDQATADRNIKIMSDICIKYFVSIEPILGPVDLWYSAFNGADSIETMPGLSGIIIGAQTGPGAVAPEREWINTIIGQVGDRPLFLKNNLLDLFPDLPRRQETAWLIDK